MPQEKLPLTRQIGYALGMTGWSIMINLIAVILVYFYLPPDDSGLPKLIIQTAIFGVFNLVAIITAGGRLLDAIYDPFIARYSDRSTNPNGRRIPLMKLAIIPSAVFCFFVFYPIELKEGWLNGIWLMCMLTGFYISSTTYIIPYNALLPELAARADDKVRLATFQSIGYVSGIAISSNAFNLTGIFQSNFEISRIGALQLAVLLMLILAAIFMLIAVLSINEKKYCEVSPGSAGMIPALKQTLTNRNFLLFIAADFSYFIAITFMISGLMYYVTVLLQLPESMGNEMMIVLVLISLLFYPVINRLVKKIYKRTLVVFSFLMLSLVFLGIYFLGVKTIPPAAQIYILIAFAAFPMASLNILPQAILAEIIQKDTEETGDKKEATYFAVRYFFIKIAQTFGIALFATFLLYGRSTGDDLGIRLSGLAGFIFCFFAALIFLRFREKS